MKKLAVGDKLEVKKLDGSVHNATIKRIGSVEHGLWVMLTLDVHGAVGYAVARQDELAADA